jgi:integrase
VQILRAAGITDLTPHDCVKFLIENRPRGAAASCHVATAVEEMLEAMERAEAGQRWIDDLRSRLTPSAKKWKQPVKPFVEHFTGPVHAALRAAALNDWLRKLKLSPRSRNNYRGAVLALAAFCKDKEYLPRTWSEMAAVKTEKIKRKRILIYEPEQCSDLLKCALPNLVPFLAIQAFAGVRTREILGDAQHTPLSWSDIRLRERQIHVPADVAKEGTPQRIIPIQENLAAWLKPYVQQKRSNGHCGSQGVCALANVTNALRRTAQRAGVPFIRNGLRKSFISYRAAVLKDIGRVADEAGNSAQIIKNHYRDVRSPEDGHRWFSIGTLQLNLDLNEEAG